MFDLIKNIFKQSSIYAFGDFLTKGVGFFLLPLYTAYLSPEDYGLISLATVAATMFTIITTGGLRGAVLKFYYNFESDKIRKQFYGSLWLFYIIVPGIFLLIFEIYGELFFDIILPSVPYDPYIRLILWAYYLKGVFIELPLEVFKAKGEAFKYSSLTVLIFIATTLSTIWLVVFRNQGAQGFLFAKFLGFLVIAVGMAFYLYKFVTISIEWAWLKRALLYSMPLVPHFLSHWVLSSSDRIVLEYFVPLSEVGIYNVAYTIGSAMSIIAIAGNNAIIPKYGDLNLTDEYEIQEIVKTATYYIASIIGIGLLIALFAEDFVYLTIPEAYHRAVSVIPWVVLGYIFMGFYFTQINMLTITMGKTKIVGVSTAAAAITNLGLNILLIPYLGIDGAAITTAFTYLLLFFGMNYISRKTCRVPFEYLRMAKVFISAIITYITSYIITPNDIYINIIFKILFVSLFVGLLIVFKFFDDKEFFYLKNKVINIINDRS